MYYTNHVYMIAHLLMKCIFSLYLVEEISEVVFGCGKSVIFVSVEFFLENDDVAVHQLLQDVLQRSIQVFDAFQHVRLDLFE